VALAHLKNPPIALGFSLDGVDDYIDCGNDLSLNPTNAITLLALLKRDAMDEEDTFLDRGWGNPYLLRVMVGNVIQFRLTLSVSGYTNWIGTKIVDTDMHLIIATFDNVSGEAKIYLDGELDKTWTGYVGETLSETAALTRIGALGSYRFDFIIGECRIYNRALSPSEISDFYSIRRNIMDGCVLKLGTLGLVRGGGTQWLDESPYKNHGTVYGAKRVRCCHCNVVRDYGT